MEAVLFLHLLIFVERKKQKPIGRVAIILVLNCLEQSKYYINVLFFLFLPYISAFIGQAIHRLLLIQAFRPDRLLAMAHQFVSTNLGENFMSIMEQPLDLTHIVDTEASKHFNYNPLTPHPPAWSPESQNDIDGALKSALNAVFLNLLNGFFVVIQHKRSISIKKKYKY